MQKNKAQEKVISRINGQMIVIACPGSGKTTTILRRIRHMTADEGIAPESVLMVTFTKAAADEMKERYARQYGGAGGVTFCTIHALCLALLKKFGGLSKEGVLANPGDVLFDLLRYNRDINDRGKFIQDALTDISRVKNGYYVLEDYEPKCTNDRELFRELYRAYEERKEEAGLADFDDLLLKTLDLLQTDPEALSFIREKYRYIHVDEYQDTNLVQRDIICRMAGEDGNLVVVGDDDQSIYSFRGASPEVMLGFTKDYPDAEQVYMTTNYRSDRAVIDAARALISHNQNRFPKEFICSSSAKGKVETACFPDKGAQLGMLAAKVKKLAEGKGGLSGIAILYRTNSQAEAVASMLSDAGVPFYSNDRLESRYNHWLYRDILSYHKVALHEGSRLDVQRTITHPNRYFKNIHVPDYDYDARKMYDALHVPGEEGWKARKLRERIHEYTALLAMLEKASPLETMRYMEHFGDYLSYIKSYAEYRNADPSEYLSLWERYKEDIKKHGITTFAQWESYRQGYEKGLAEIQSRRTGVALSTMHKAKGLEWDNVFVIDCVDGTIPYTRTTDADIEDERRLFYVAVTRAKHGLWLYSYSDAKNRPSRFLSEAGL